VVRTAATVATVAVVVVTVDAAETVVAVATVVTVAATAVVVTVASPVPRVATVATAAASVVVPPAASTRRSATSTSSRYLVPVNAPVSGRGRFFLRISPPCEAWGKVPPLEQRISPPRSGQRSGGVVSDGTAAGAED